MNADGSDRVINLQLMFDEVDAAHQQHAGNRSDHECAGAVNKSAWCSNRHQPGQHPVGHQTEIWLAVFDHCHDHGGNRPGGRR